MYTSPIREPLVSGEKSYKDITDDVVRPIVNTPGKMWYLGMTVSTVLLLVGVFSLFITVRNGIGMWGVNKTIGWGWAITNLVWWIGIGHAGTFISAILLLFRQKWRTGINRSAEAMTIFAVMCAGIFPLIHMGRLPLGYFILPYPNTRELWVNFNSPLLWDVFAISTYFAVSLLFWFSGLIPDIATMRDTAKNKIGKIVYGF
jgi:Ni/Fe-hydrogenase subunit HybB-like protein